MSADNGIYIGSWNVNGGKIYSVVETSAIDNLDYYKRQGVVQLENYIKSVWGAGKLFTDQSEAVLCGVGYERDRPTEYGVVVLETFTTPAPHRVMDWLAKHATKSNTETKFWLVYTPTGQNPSFRHPSLESAQKEAARLAKLHHASFFVMEAVSKAEATFSQVAIAG